MKKLFFLFIFCSTFNLCHAGKITQRYEDAMTVFLATLIGQDIRSTNWKEALKGVMTFLESDKTTIINKEEYARSLYLSYVTLDNMETKAYEYERCQTTEYRKRLENYFSISIKPLTLSSSDKGAINTALFYANLSCLFLLHGHETEIYKKMTETVFCITPQFSLRMAELCFNEVDQTEKVKSQIKKLQELSKSLYSREIKPNVITNHINQLFYDSI